MAIKLNVLSWMDINLIVQRCRLHQMRYSLNDKSSKQTFGVNNAMFPTVPPPFLVSGVDVFGKAFLLGLCVGLILTSVRKLKP